MLQNPQLLRKIWCLSWSCKLQLKVVSCLPVLVIHICTDKGMLTTVISPFRNIKKKYWNASRFSYCKWNFLRRGRGPDSYVSNNHVWQERRRLTSVHTSSCCFTFAPKYVSCDMKNALGSKGQWPARRIITITPAHVRPVHTSTRVQLVVRVLHVS